MKLTTRVHDIVFRQILKRSFKPLSAVVGLLALQGTAAAQDSATNAPAGGATPPAVSSPDDTLGGTNSVIKLAKPKRNQISFSGDFSLEEGKITLPVGYSLKDSLKGLAAVQTSVDSPKRNSDYYGGTVSYSPDRDWFFDFSYAQGKSTGTQTLGFGRDGTGSGDFTLDDDWYQGYVRYNFPKLTGKKLSAYARLGATYVNSTLNYSTTTPVALLGFYSQSDKTTDIYGNVGAGATYLIYKWGDFSVGLQGEVEGLGGIRNQDSLETLKDDPGLRPETAHINNTVFGGLGKGTLHLEYRLGKSGTCRLFMDAGAQYQFLEVSYPSQGDKTETLWGPYVNLGLRYSF